MFHMWLLVDGYTILGQLVLRHNIYPHICTADGYDHEV